jgi:uncharacterized membrane protein (DUF2068 family)
MVRSATWGGWIAFAGVLMVIIGSLDFFEGLIAIIRDDYYVLTQGQLIVFDLTTWGWITLIWGVIVVIAGFGLLSAQSWGRWLAIFACSLNFLVQLGFLGSSAYPLWALTTLSLTLVVLYALIARWDTAVEAS